MPTSAPALVYLLGYPASGKYTIAKALAGTPGRSWIVVDNHQINNVIFAVIEPDGITPLPTAVWDRAGEVREAVLTTIETLSPPSLSFIFTNVLFNDQPADHRLFHRLADLAAARGSIFIPVLLHCTVEELERRITNVDRVARMKLTDRAGIAAYVRAHPLLRPSAGHPLDLDVSSLPPSAAAGAILQHVEAALAASGGGSR